MFGQINMDFQKFHFTEAIYMPLTLTVLVTTIDALQHFETG